jgi:hypothetical protein
MTQAQRRFVRSQAVELLGLASVFVVFGRQIFAEWLGYGVAAITAVAFVAQVARGWPRVEADH